MWSEKVRDAIRQVALVGLLHVGCVVGCGEVVRLQGGLGSGWGLSGMRHGGVRGLVMDPKAYDACS